LSVRQEGPTALVAQSDAWSQPQVCEARHLEPIVLDAHWSGALQPQK